MSAWFFVLLFAGGYLIGDACQVDKWAFAIFGIILLVSGEYMMNKDKK